MPKLSYFFGSTSEPLLSKTIPDVLKESVERSPDQLFIVSVHQDIHKNYWEVDHESSVVASSLTRLGLGEGDRIGIWSVNCYEWIVTMIAASKIGSILVSINPGYKEKELEYCLKLTECHTLITYQSFKTSNYVAILENVAPGITSIGNGINISHERLPFLKNVIFIDQVEGSAPSNILRFSQLFECNNNNCIMDEGQIRPPKECKVTFDDAVNIQFTSGTTGNPKGATLTHHNVVNNAYFTGKRLLEGLGDEAKVICVPNPLIHCFGSTIGIMIAMIYTRTVVLPAPVATAVATLHAIQKYKCDIVYGTPTMFIDMLTEPSFDKFDKTSVKRAIMGGSICPVETVKRLKDEFPNLSLVAFPYGCTELSPVMTFTEFDAPDEYALSTVGRATEHVEIKICHPETGRVLERGVSGEIRSRGYLTFRGYWNQPDKTSQAFDANGWYKTGDMGVMNEKGYITVMGRIDDMIIRGGENIYPKEIEEFLLSHPAVADVNVVGVPDDRMGEEICACIIPRKSCSPNQYSPDDIRIFCMGKISHFKIPKYIIFIEKFPRTATMKIQKKNLREAALRKLHPDQLNQR